MTRRRRDRGRAIAVLAAAAALSVLAFALRGGGDPAPAVAEASPSPTTSPLPSVTATPNAPSPTATAEPTDVGTPPPSPSPAATPPPTITLAFGGDTHGERQIGAAILRGEDPLAAIAPVLSAADFTVLNLETAVGTSGEAGDKSYTFQAPPQLFDALVGAGVDLVSVANNHSLDYGVDALMETLAEARARGVVAVGGGRNDAEAYSAHIAEVGGMRIAFVGLTRVIPVPEWAATPQRPGLASAYTVARAAEAVRVAAAAADHVVAIVHWGQERQDCPDEYQVQLAEALHGAGATVVVGHHPHVWQGVSAPSPGRLSAFSLGNFLWYASGEVSGLTGVLTVEIGPDGVTGWSVTPAVIAADGGPVPSSGATAERLLARASELAPGIACPAGGTPRP